MAAAFARRRIRQRRYIPRKHGWPARIMRQEQAALEECRLLFPFSVGWWLCFLLPTGTWQQRKARLNDFARWRESFVAWRDAFTTGILQAFQGLTDWYQQNKAEIESLLAAPVQEGEQAGE